MSAFSISHASKTRYPNHPYEKIKDDILGTKYNVTLHFVGSTRARQLNRTYRQRTYVPNVLAFPLEDSIGEIFITPIVAKREAHKFSMSADGYIGYLFIHACLHLKGHDHGATMERAEKRYCHKYHLR